MVAYGVRGSNYVSKLISVEIYPVDSFIHLLNNWGLIFRKSTLTLRFKIKKQDAPKTKFVSNLKI